MEPNNASGSTAKSKAQSRKINWEAVAIQVGISLLSGVAMAAGSAVIGSLAGTAAAETMANTTSALSLVKKVV